MVARGGKFEGRQRQVGRARPEEAREVGEAGGAGAMRPTRALRTSAAMLRLPRAGWALKLSSTAASGTPRKKARRRAMLSRCAAVAAARSPATTQARRSKNALR